MKTYNVIGLMSGTSLDGLDICYVKFNYPSLSFEILAANTMAYPKDWILKLKDAIHLSGNELCKLDMDYGFYLGETVRSFLREYNIENVDLIASHGHTVFHNPKERYTLQIGNGAAIHAETGLKTICDFRVQDVALGGQGAPLVPIGDEILFGQYEACLNLGGISNISFRKNNERIAFDISPFNLVLNYLAEKTGKLFDEDGTLAKSGKVNIELLNQLNSLAYYKAPSPKSLGIEFCYSNVFPLIEESALETKDLLATFVEHFAFQIAEVFNKNSIKNVLVTGGGTYNKFFIETLKGKTATKIILPENQIIDYKEALVFALMGVLKSEEEINVLKSVTGAQKNHSSGIVYG